MARSEIKNKPNPPIRQEVPVSLSLKITGIVFWGLVLIGLILVVGAINWLEQDLTRHHGGIENVTFVLTQETLEQSPTTSDINIRRSLKKVLESTGAQGVVIVTEQRGRIAVGDTRNDLNKRTLYFTINPPAELNLPPDKAKLTIYQTPIDVLLSEQKKKLMAIMGLLFFVFGMMLQWILKKILSDPIQQMVNTAVDFRNGRETSFNDKRKDEFGYLARFINKALDSLTARQHELSYQASHDTLTGLHNRAEFDHRLREYLEHQKTDDSHATLFYMDLDQFKIINDTCGHVAGDELLRQIAHTLKAELRESDFIARLGGDEFGVLLFGCTQADALHLAEKLLDAVRVFHFRWEDKVFQVGVSIGVVPITPQVKSVTKLLSSADVACYAAKEKGRNQVHIYAPGDRDVRRKHGEMLWVTQIRDALKNDNFQLYQQPIIHVMKDDKINPHYEILLRLVDEDGSCVTPMSFLGAAELYGLMPEIDSWVLQNVFNWIVDNEGNTQPYSNIAINLSGQSISHKTFLDKVVDLLTGSDVDPEKICFEITETTAIANLELAKKFIHVLKGMGCNFALDDFGSGMSSFSYLKNLPVDYLKIDGSYVRDLVNDPIDRAMVTAVNQIGHAMGIKTIAEFVEDQATIGALAAIGVDYAQGHGIARPAPLDNLLLSGPADIAIAKSRAAD
jgi:diguanylate cyclase (GGDEF)-like protein